MSDDWTALKPALRKACLENGVPASSVDEVVDLSCHATQQALDTFLRIVRSAGSAQVAACTMGIGASLLEYRLENLNSIMAKKASAMGMTLAIVKLDGAS